MIHRQIYTLYTLFSRSIDREHTYKFTDKSEKLVDNFISTFEKKGVSRHSLGIVFLYDYFCDTYNYWTNSGRELKTVPFSWVVGQPQIKRWEKRYEDYVYSYTEGFLSHVDITPLSEVKLLFTSSEGRSYDVAEDTERRRFHNQPGGLINCILNTSLVTKSSYWCSTCKYKEECIDELVTRDRELALRRGFISLKKDSNG